ncbi:MAG: amidohydrolase, partial [Gammaproteobacteria bacterium]|nr:amidohydrolase [Gammaproteobacteria bacterium]
MKRKVLSAAALLWLLAAPLARGADPGGETASGDAAAYYAIGDFGHVDKIDAHVHVHGPAERFVAQAMADRFRILTISVDSPDFPPIPVQLREAVSLHERYPGWVAFASTFSVEGFQSPGWSDAAIRKIDAARAQGAVGVKIWKNIGMVLRDPDGSYV